jgi:hypothetical protein
MRATQTGASVETEEAIVSEAAAQDFPDLSLDGGIAGPIYCANCIHCKLLPSPAEAEGLYRLRVRCDAGKWRKKLGEEKVYKYFTVARRSIAACSSYEDMGDSDEFIQDLRRILPTSDELYSH